MRRLIAIAASLACGSVAALDISPPAPLSCGGNAGETMTGAVVSLLEGNAQRTYRTVSPTATGTVTLAFTKRTSAVTLDGVRLKCVFSSTTGERTYQTDFRIPPATVPVGDTPRTAVSIQASPRKITWSPATVVVPPVVVPPVLSPGTTATLTWNASTDPRVVGYRVYYGTASRTYVQARNEGIKLGLVTTYTVTGLEAGKRYYFAVTAFKPPSPEVDESPYSNEVFKDF